jgi:hypothetical protein
MKACSAVMRRLPPSFDSAARVTRSPRALLDPIEEALDDLELDVGLEQAHAHVAQGLVDHVVGELSDSREPLLGGAEALREGLEHRRSAPCPAGRDAPIPHQRHGISSLQARMCRSET